MKHGVASVAIALSAAAVALAVIFAKPNGKNPRRRQLRMSTAVYPTASAITAA